MNGPVRSSLKILISRTTLAFVCGALLVWSQPATAQTVTGSISGTVTDASGQALPGATVTLLSERTGEARKLTSSGTGAFTFPSLQPGTYTIRVEREGFQAYERKNNILTASEHLAVGQISLSLGAMTETISVEAHGSAVETGSAERSALLSSKQLEMVAVRGRDIVALLKVLPGVTSASDYTESESLGGGFGTRAPNIQGVRDSFSSFTVDGLVGNDMGTPRTFSSTINFEAIDEVKVQLNNYRAESGRTGGATVSIVTKSGTQDFHGSVYGFKRDESLNANDTFNNRNKRPRPIYRHTNLGVTLGGPVYLPGVFNDKKEKLFFFYSFEHLDTLTPQPLRQVTLPTQRERNGDFSQSFDLNGKLIVIRDPVTGQPFPGNIIPTSRINRNGQALLDRFPLPNRVGANPNFNHDFQESLDVPKRSHVLRLDFKPGPRDSFYVRGSHWNSNTGGDSGGFAVPAGGANWGFVPMSYTFVDDSVVAHYTRIFSSTVVSEFSGGWRRGSEDHLVGDAALDSVRKSSIGYGLGQFYPEANPLGIMPQAQFAGIPNDARFTYDGRFPLFGDDTIWSLTNNTTVIRGSHTLKGGVYFERSHNVEGLTANFGGQFFFDRDAQNPLDTNNAYANALLGVFKEYRESSSRPPTDGFSSIAEGYLQDTWKLNRKLTLDYGVRFAWYTHWKQGDGQAAAFSLERYNAGKAPRLFQPVIVNGQRRAKNPISGEILPAVYIGAFVPNSGDPFNGMVQETDDTYPEGFKDQEPVLLEPRLGFAYDLAGNGKTAIRGGFGIFHNLRAAGGTLRTLTQQPPVQLNPRVFYGDMATFLSTKGTLFPSNVDGWQKNVKTPVVYNFSIGVQRDIGFGTVADVAYVGSLQRNLEQRRNINRVAPGARFLAQNQDPTRAGQPLPDDFFRPYPGYGNINLHTNDGVSNYHSLQVAANRRFTKGLQFGVAYTYSKAKGNSDVDNDEVATYFDPSQREYDYTSFDQTHVFVLNYTWDLPKASGLWNNGVVRALFDDWQISGITTFASGNPRELGTGASAFTTVDGADITGGGDTVRVVLTGDPNAGKHTPDRWFDTSVVKRPAKGDYGNASRLPVRGPGINNWDLTLFKNIPIHRDARLQLRWEIYNLFNHPQYLDFDRTPRFDATGQQVNPRFGQVISARNARIMQGALRFTF